MKTEKFRGDKEQMKKTDKADFTLETAFEKNTRENMVDIAKTNGFRGYSTLRKKDFAEWLSKLLLRDDYMEEILNHADEEELAIFEAATRSESGIPISEEMFWSSRLISSYAVYGKDSCLRVPTDVQDKFQLLYTEEFQKKHHRKWLLYSYCISAIYLYGVLTLRELTEIYNKFEEEPLKEKETEEICAEMNDSGFSVVVKSPYIMEAGLAEEELYRKLLQVQGDIPFYIPEKKTDFLSYGMGIYQDSNAYTRKFTDYLKRRLKMEEVQAVLLFQEMQEFIRSNYSAESMLETLEQEGYHFPVGGARKNLIQEIETVRKHIRLWDHRGYTFAERRNRELEKRMQSIHVLADQVKRNFAALEDSASGKGKKIYPNELCPCGSGRKYKHCCGKKK